MAVALDGVDIARRRFAKGAQVVARRCPSRRRRRRSGRQRSDQGVTRSPVGSRLVSSRTTIAPAPPEADVEGRSVAQAGARPDDPRVSDAVVSTARAPRPDRRRIVGDDDDLGPVGHVRVRSGQRAGRSAGQSVATRMTVAMPSPVRRAEMAPSRWSRSARGRRPCGLADGRARGKSVPRSTTFQPAASISARRRSAVAKSRAARASERARGERRGPRRAVASRVVGHPGRSIAAGRPGTLRRWIAPCGPCCSAPSRCVSAPA